MGVGEVIFIVLAVFFAVSLIGSGIWWLLDKLAESFKD